MDDIMVSILCLTYNHSPYLRKCLDSFLMQKTDFRYEILIHDDASTDNTQEIIKEYEQKYPDIIKPIYQKENQQSQKIKINMVYQFPRAKGKYIAFCEGDDYWTDEYKLQKQYDMLKKHHDCKLCVHTVDDISEDGKSLDISHPDCKVKEGVIRSEDFVKQALNYYYQTSSYFFEKPDEVCKDIPKFLQILSIDTSIMLLMASKGNAYYIDKAMSCYRHGAAQSWNTRFQKSSNSSKINRFNKVISMYEAFDEFSERRFHDSLENKIMYLKYRILKYQGAVLKIRRLEYKEYFINDKKQGINPYKDCLINSCPKMYSCFLKLRSKLKGKT